MKMPETKYGGMPIWFHHHGTKMRVKEIDVNKQRLIIAGSAAEIRIDGADVNGFKVQWNVIFSYGYGIVGVTYMKKSDLSSAFGLEDEIGTFGEWLLNRFGGTCANQEKYIRYDRYLNIPGPGTGNDGDPNVSIVVDEEMQNAVRKLFSAKEPTMKCPKCGTEGPFDEKDYFICPACGHKQHVLMRRELMDLDDPKEGALAVDIAGKSLL